MAQKSNKQAGVSRWTSLATSLLALLAFGCGGGGGGGGTQPPSKDLPDAVADTGGGGDTVVTDTGGGEVSQGDVGGEVAQDTKPGEEVTQPSKKPRMREIVGHFKQLNDKLAIGAECRGKENGKDVRKKFLAVLEPKKQTFRLTVPKGFKCTMSVKYGDKTKKVKFVRQQIQKPQGSKLSFQTIKVTAYTIPDALKYADIGTLDFLEDPEVVIGDNVEEYTIWRNIDSDKDGMNDYEDPDDNNDGKPDAQDPVWQQEDDWIGSADWVNWEGNDLCDPSNELCIPEPDESLDENDCANSDYDYCYEEGEQGYEDFEGFCQAFPAYCQCDEEQECGYDLLGNPCERQCGEGQECVYDYYCVDPQEVCVPQCPGNAQCGDDAGCGYVCDGSCPDGEVCMEKDDGTVGCVNTAECQPSCEYCGADDGCGGICLEGPCQYPNEQCVDGECVCDPDPNCECGQDDGCGGICWYGPCPSQDQECYYGECIPTSCTPDCEGKQCGEDDGCGSTCDGPCSDGGVCIDMGGAFQCCWPQCDGYCDGRDDTCGGQCFDCPEGYECSDGECV